MLEGQDLRDALDSIRLIEHPGPFHRYVQHRFIALALAAGAPLHVLSGEWARKTGGRFNYPHRHRTTYLAADAATASAEGERTDNPARPYVHIPIRGRLQRVLDLTDMRVRERLEVSIAQLTAEWRLLNAKGQEASSQRLGRSLYMAGSVESVAYPSTARGGGVCLAVFPERLARGSFLEVEDKEQILRERIPE